MSVGDIATKQFHNDMLAFNHREKPGYAACILHWSTQKTIGKCWTNVAA